RRFYPSWRAARREPAGAASRRAAGPGPRRRKGRPRHGLPFLCGRRRLGGRRTRTAAEASSMASNWIVRLCAMRFLGAFTPARGKLEMELVDVEQLFGGERILFYFLAEKRVDFRELVKDLARRYQTRIEMRQIGVRDEAKLLADYGDCGKPVCCNTHMSVMPPVSMRMAKLQKSTLDPSKISGRCGRLKCCLRFEQDVYEEFQKELPQPG